MNQIQTEVIFLNLLRQADEFIFSIVGTNPAGDSGSFRARVSNLFATFQADKSAFVASAVQLGFLATLLKEYAAFRLSPVENIGTPEILIGQIRWEDIYDKPDILAASSDWEDINNKPTTFPHDEVTWSEVTGKPTTFPHDEVTWSEVTGKPTTFPHDEVTWSEVTGKPAAYAIDYATVSYVGNGSASRNISFTPAVTIRAVMGRRNDGLCFLWWGGLDSLLSFGTPGVMTINSVGWNQSGSTYNLILLP